jgi:bifunctional DNA-binding transcriptional regulator/antitoxin component of YhaV-PrlF toxin-antitoxin module
MRRLTSKITIKGQATIPVIVRRHLGLNVGDKVEYVVLNPECAVIRAAAREGPARKGGKGKGQVKQPTDGTQGKRSARKRGR